MRLDEDYAFYYTISMIFHPTLTTAIIPMVALIFMNTAIFFGKLRHLYYCGPPQLTCSFLLLFSYGNQFTLSLLRAASKLKQKGTSGRSFFADHFALFLEINHFNESGQLCSGASRTQLLWAFSKDTPSLMNSMLIKREVPKGVVSTSKVH